MYQPRADLWLRMLLVEQHDRIEAARLARLARRPRRRSLRRFVGRRLMRVGARLAADPALHRAPSA